MAKFYRHNNGIGWFETTWIEIAKYSGNMNPVCDKCLKPLNSYRTVLVPILNQTYCPECGEMALAGMHQYSEDKHIEERREQFWLNYFGIEGRECN